MGYADDLQALIGRISHALIDWDAPLPQARIPTQASSDFLLHKQQGDWAEDLVFRAINENAKHHVAVRYGRSEDLVAGSAGFEQFYREFHEELSTIGKRPDLLIFNRSDFDFSLGIDISRIEHRQIAGLVKKAVAGIEVRSSSFLIGKYDAAAKERSELLETEALELRDHILQNYRAQLTAPARSHLIPLLESLTKENTRLLSFKKPSLRSSEELIALGDALSRLKTIGKELQRRDFLSITPKVEDIKTVYRWASLHQVPHFYFQVFFDRVFGLPYTRILELLADPQLEGVKYHIEADEKNQNKTTIKINSKEGLELAGKVDMPAHESRMKELSKGRLLFYVTFMGGEAYIDIQRLAGILGIPAQDL